MTVLGLIPARRGSKRLPGKNTRLLGGKPLIAWTIEAAQQSKTLTHIVCSTDDEAAMGVCLEHDVDVIVRPPELATDGATTEDVVRHALGIHRCDSPRDILCLLQPTSPFRTAEDIDRCVEMARDGYSVVSGIEWQGAWRPNGAVYAVPVPLFHSGGFKADEVYRMPAGRSVDIDTAEDFELAERMVRLNASAISEGRYGKGD